MKTLHCCERVNNFLWRQLLSHGELGVTAVPVVTPLYNLFAMRVHQKGFRYAVITVIGVIKSPKVVLCDSTVPLGDSTKVRHNYSMGRLAQSPASTAGGSITSRICQLATQQNFLQTPSRLPPAYLVGGKCGIAAKHPLPSKTPTRTLSRTRSS